MACINFMVKNSAVTNNQFVAATAIIGRSNIVKFGKGIGSATTTTLWRTKKNIMPAIKVQLHIDNDGHKNNKKPNGEFRNSEKFDCKVVLESLFREQAAELDMVLKNPKLQEELDMALRDFSLYYAESLTKHYKNEEGKGPEIYVKREDMNHFGAIAEVMIAKHMGRKRVVAAIRDGQLGITTAVACAKHGLDCTIFMASYDIDNQSSSVQLIKSLGAQVKSIEGNLNNALLAARQEWTTVTEEEWMKNLERSSYLTGTVVRPHPGSSLGSDMVKFPDVVLGCIGSASNSNALALFHEFIHEDQDVRLIGVVADTGIIPPSQSLGEELEYPGEGLKLSFVKETTKVEYYTVTDTEAMEAYNNDLLYKFEAILSSSNEASYAFAYLHKLCPTLPDGCKVFVVIKC